MSNLPKRVFLKTLRHGTFEVNCEEGKKNVTLSDCFKFLHEKDIFLPYKVNDDTNKKKDFIVFDGKKIETQESFERALTSKRYDEVFYVPF